jgi:hypothetical protein
MHSKDCIGSMWTNVKFAEQCLMYKLHIEIEIRAVG